MSGEAGVSIAEITGVSPAECVVTTRGRGMRVNADVLMRDAQKEIAQLEARIVELKAERDAALSGWKRSLFRLGEREVPPGTFGGAFSGSFGGRIGGI